MSKTIFCGGAIFGIVASGMLLNAAHGQDISKPFSESQLTKHVDSLAIGDPRTKQPLSIGDDKPLKKASAEKVTKKDKGPTEITATEGSTFDNKTHKAVFYGKVVVKDPEFNVTCDTLTAFMKQDKAAEKPGDKPVEPGVIKTPKAEEKPEKETKSGGLEKAIAEMTGEGRVFITQEKVEADGTVSRNIGRGRKAVYEAGTGDITLTGMPSIQQGYNTCIGLEESTVMVLNREGRMRVNGPHKTVIKDTSSDNNPPSR